MDLHQENIEDPKDKIFDARYNLLSYPHRVGINAELADEPNIVINVLKNAAKPFKRISRQRVNLKLGSLCDKAAELMVDQEHWTNFFNEPLSVRWNCYRFSVLSNIVKGVLIIHKENARCIYSRLKREYVRVYSYPYNTNFTKIIVAGPPKKMVPITQPETIETQIPVLDNGQLEIPAAATIFDPQEIVVPPIGLDKDLPVILAPATVSAEGTTVVAPQGLDNFPTTFSSGALVNVEEAEDIGQEKSDERAAVSYYKRIYEDLDAIIPESELSVFPPRTSVSRIQRLEFYKKFEIIRPGFSKKIRNPYLFRFPGDESSDEENGPHLSTVQAMIHTADVPHTDVEQNTDIISSDNHIYADDRSPPANVEQPANLVASSNHEPFAVPHIPPDQIHLLTAQPNNTNVIYADVHVQAEDSPTAVNVEQPAEVVTTSNLEPVLFVHAPTVQPRDFIIHPQQKLDKTTEAELGKNLSKLKTESTGDKCDIPEIVITNDPTSLQDTTEFHGGLQAEIKRDENVVSVIEEIEPQKQTTTTEPNVQLFQEFMNVTENEFFAKPIRNRRAPKVIFRRKRVMQNMFDRNVFDPKYKSPSEILEFRSERRPPLLNVHGLMNDGINLDVHKIMEPEEDYLSIFENEIDCSGPDLSSIISSCLSFVLQGRSGGIQERAASRRETKGDDLFRVMRESVPSAALLRSPVRLSTAKRTGSFVPVDHQPEVVLSKDLQPMTIPVIEDIHIRGSRVSNLIDAIQEINMPTQTNVVRSSQKVDAVKSTDVIGPFDKTEVPRLTDSTVPTDNLEIPDVVRKEQSFQTGQELSLERKQDVISANVTDQIAGPQLHVEGALEAGTQVPVRPTADLIDEDVEKRLTAYVIPKNVPEQIPGPQLQIEGAAEARAQVPIRPTADLIDEVEEERQRANVIPQNVTEQIPGPQLCVEGALEPTADMIDEAAEERQLASARMKAVTKFGVYETIISLFDSESMPIRFSDLCPMTTRREIVAKTFRILLTLHAEQRIFLEYDSDYTSSESVLIYTVV